MSERNKPLPLKKGDRIRWMAVNGLQEGVILSKQQGYDLLVRLDNGKHVIVSCYSIKAKTNG